MLGAVLREWVLAPEGCLFYVGPDPRGTVSVQGLLCEPALRTLSSQNPQGCPFTSSGKETETVKVKLRKKNLHA